MIDDEYDVPARLLIGASRGSIPPNGPGHHLDRGVYQDINRPPGGIGHQAGQPQLRVLTLLQQVMDRVRGDRLQQRRIQRLVSGVGLQRVPLVQQGIDRGVRECPHGEPPWLGVVPLG